MLLRDNPLNTLPRFFCGATGPIWGFVWLSLRVSVLLVSSASCFFLLFTMIQRRAKEMDPVPKSSGRKTDITPEEKLTAKRLVLALGCGQSRHTILKWRSYWKLLSDLHNQGATTLLCYQTSEFKTYVFPCPNQLDCNSCW